jgi:hypothetical protein
MVGYDIRCKKTDEKSEKNAKKSLSPKKSFELSKFHVFLMY